MTSNRHIIYKTLFLTSVTAVSIITGISMARGNYANFGSSYTAPNQTNGLTTQTEDQPSRKSRHLMYSNAHQSIKFSHTITNFLGNAFGKIKALIQRCYGYGISLIMTLAGSYLLYKSLNEVGTYADGVAGAKIPVIPTFVAENYTVRFPRVCPQPEGDESCGLRAVINGLHMMIALETGNRELETMLASEGRMFADGRFVSQEMLERLPLGQTGLLMLDNNGLLQNLSIDLCAAIVGQSEHLLRTYEEHTGRNIELAEKFTFTRLEEILTIKPASLDGTINATDKFVQLHQRRGNFKALQYLTVQRMSWFQLLNKSICPQKEKNQATMPFIHTLLIHNPAVEHFFSVVIKTDPGHKTEIIVLETVPQLAKTYANGLRKLHQNPRSKNIPGASLALHTIGSLFGSNNPFGIIPHDIEQFAKHTHFSPSSSMEAYNPESKGKYKGKEKATS